MLKAKKRRLVMGPLLVRRRSRRQHIIHRDHSLIRFRRRLLLKVAVLPRVVEVAEGVVEVVVVVVAEGVEEKAEGVEEEMVVVAVGIGEKKKERGMLLLLVNLVVLGLWALVRTLVDGVEVEGEAGGRGEVVVDKEIRGRPSRPEDEGLVGGC